MNTRLVLSFVCLGMLWSAAARAQDLTDTVADGSYHVLGGETVTSETRVADGWAPVNGNVAYVYDPNFYFYMHGYQVSPAYDRRAEFKNYGYVVVDAAGDPGGNYKTAPSWLTHTGFSASFANGVVDLSFSYNATYVPVMRGYQGYIIYANLKKVAPAASLFVYDDKLRFGPGNYLFTGDGPEQQTSLMIGVSDAVQGGKAIQVQTIANTGGTHWKLMLFANGNAAAYNGVDLRGYKKLAFYAKASRNVVLQGGFGTGDDTGYVGFPQLAVGTSYKRFEIDISGVNRSDINTAFWVYLHKNLNPFDFAGVSVFFDGIELITDLDTANIVVDKADDTTDGVCSRTGGRTGSCNLRAALALAGTVHGQSNVSLTVDSSLTQGQLEVPAGSNVVISGGKSITRGGLAYARAFNVAGSASLTLKGITVSGFSLMGGWDDGAAIKNNGVVTLDGATLSNNSVTQFNVGAMTAFSMGSDGGAVSNTGKLVLRGGARLDHNTASGTASTASYTNASAFGGAITNAGQLIIDGPASFSSNTAEAVATSGFHNAPIGGATAAASGGAISNVGGTISVVGAGIGHCSFTGNSASARTSVADPVNQTESASSAGGAISSAVALDIPDGACSFEKNSALQDPNIHIEPN